MLVRVGSCTGCEALFQLPETFSEPWVRCSICEGAVSVGEPTDPAEASRTRRGGRSKSSGGREPKARAPRTAKPAAVAAAVAEAPNLKGTDLKGTDPKAASPEAPAPKVSIPEAELTEEPVQAEVRPITAAPVAEPSKPSIPARPAMPEPEWSPNEMQRKVDEREAGQAPKAKSPAAKAPAEQSAEKVAEKAAPKITPKAAPKPRVEKPKETSTQSLVEIEPSRKSSGTLERLKRERLEAERAAQQASAMPAQKPRESTLERLKRERAEQAGRDTAPAASAGRSSRAAAPQPARQRSAAPARSSRRQSAEEDDGSGARRSGSRRSGGRSGSSRGSSKDKSMVPGLIGLGAIVVLGGGFGLGMSQGWFSGKPATQDEVAEADSDSSDKDKQVLGAEGTIPPPVADPFAGLPTAAGYEGSVPEGSSEEPAADSPSESPELENATEASEPDTEGAEPEETRPPGKHPDDVDLAQYGPYEKLAETTDEEWAELEKQADYLFDLYSGKKGANAKDKLAEAGKAAWPAILNRFLQLDMADEEHVEVGQQVAALMDSIVIPGARNGWLPDATLAGQWRNKRVIETWARRWDRILADPAEWVKFVGEDAGS